MPPVPPVSSDFNVTQEEGYHNDVTEQDNPTVETGISGEERGFHVEPWDIAAPSDDPLVESLIVDYLSPVANSQHLAPSQEEANGPTEDTQESPQGLARDPEDAAQEIVAGDRAQVLVEQEQQLVDNAPPEVHRVEYVDEVADQDVLCGAGGASNIHPGNQIYRDLVNTFRHSYHSVLRTEKAFYVKVVIALVKKDGGRFLIKDRVSGRYYEAPDGTVRAKVYQALREKRENILTRRHPRAG